MNATASPAPIVTPVTVRDAEALAKAAIENGPPFRGAIVERVTALVMRVDVAAREQSGAKELLAALQGLGAHPEFGYCFCLNREQQAAGHTGECREARAAIFKVDPESRPTADPVPPVVDLGV